MRDTVVVAGHVAERGSEAERLLRESDNLKRYADDEWRVNRRMTGAHYDSQSLDRLFEAMQAPGYLGPATDTETTK